jgi:predicted dehydrogenase/NADPH:quinone reductase-like Zn-dependent oxidoreductase
MRQVIQNIRNGKLSVVEVPDPMVRAGHVLIANAFSVISAGTEKMVIDLAKKSLLGKAKERPDQVHRILEKLKNEGILNTIAQVREKLDEPMPMGYSSSGIVLACGKDVQEFKPDDKVASNGPHAGIVCVPKHLCAKIPEGVQLDSAAFTILGAIALQGVRLAHLGIGEKAFVIGLGLIGQMTVALLKAQGCQVFGTDLDEARCRLAIKMGADEASPDLKVNELKSLTLGFGVDAVLITASTKLNEPIEMAAECVRKRGRVVAVGEVSLNLPRRPFYFKEAEFVVSCSYGPGRYDAEYEERGKDYPFAYVRWTEQRNMQAVLGLMVSGKLDVSPLISHRFKIENAKAAYELIEKGSEPYLGILIEYGGREVSSLKKIEIRTAPQTSIEGIGVGVLGVGNFARLVLLPALRKIRAFKLRTLCSAGGLSAVQSGSKFGFEIATSNEDEVYKDPAVGAIFILTRHDQHARQVIKALQAGKHVFVEKPLCITTEELNEIIECYSAIRNPQSAMPLLMVGFNRRFSPAAVQVKRFFEKVKVPLTISIRFNAGEIPPEHWTQDEMVGGGRIIGEACHAIDLALFFASSPPVRVFAESVGGLNTPAVKDDQCFITLRHENGSISSVAYLAGGDKAFPKERVEIIGGGRIAVIDDFREVTLCSNGKIKKTRLLGQDKGHRGEVEAFSNSLINGDPSPILWEDLKRVTLASLLAVRSLREGVPFNVA